MSHSSSADRGESLQSAAATVPRRVSLDVMRGFLLFNSFIMVPLVPALAELEPSAMRDFLVYQFSHPAWEGYSYVDAGFPAYMTLLAASLSLSLSRRLAAGRTKGDFMRVVVTRFVLLMICSFFFEGGFSHPIGQLRLVGIFAKMALCLLFSGMLLMTFGPRARAVILAAFFAAHWAVLALVPVPGFGAGDYSEAGSVETYLRSLTVGYLSETFGISRGLGTVVWWYLNSPKILGSCLLGLLLGDLLTSRRSVVEQARIIVTIGSLALLLSWIWDIWLPINKHLWTPSFVLFSAGLLLVLLGVAMFLTEVGRSPRIVFAFSAFGRHPLLAWIVYFTLVPFDDLARRLFGPPFAPVFGQYHRLVLAITQVGLCWLFFAWIRVRETRPEPPVETGH